MPTRKELEAECERLAKVLEGWPDTLGSYHKVEAALDRAEQRLRDCPAETATGQEGE